MRMLRIVALLAFVPMVAGCTMIYRDKQGRDHYVGLMHVVAAGSEEAWITHARTVGLTVDHGPYCSSVTLGAVSSIRAAPPATDGIYMLDYVSARPFDASLVRVEKDRIPLANALHTVEGMAGASDTSRPQIVMVPASACQWQEQLLIGAVEGEGEGCRTAFLRRDGAR